MKAEKYMDFMYGKEEELCLRAFLSFCRIPFSFPQFGVGVARLTAQQSFFAELCCSLRSRFPLFTSISSCRRARWVFGGAFSRGSSRMHFLPRFHADLIVPPPLRSASPAP